MDFFRLNKLTIKSFGVYSCRIENSDKTIAPRDFYSLSYRKSGSTELICDGKTIKSESGAVTFVPRAIQYSHIVKKPSDIIAIHFNIAENIDTDIAVISPKNIAEIEYIFNSLLNSWKHNPVSGNISCLLQIYRVLSVLCTSELKKSSYRIYRALEPAIGYIRQNYTNSDFSIVSLAELSGFSEAYFRRLFEQAFEISPVKYIIKLRMDCAKRLLETGFYTVSEVAYRSGFESSSYFCTQFKKETGITPKQYVNVTSI